eukprot:gene11732-19471_t
MFRERAVRRLYAAELRGAPPPTWRCDAEVAHSAPQP